MKYQERCDRCGRWVADCGLVWSDETYTEAICDNCLRIQQAAEQAGAIDGATRSAKWVSSDSLLDELRGYRGG